MYAGYVRVFGNYSMGPCELWGNILFYYIRTRPLRTAQTVPGRKRWQIRPDKAELMSAESSE